MVAAPETKSAGEVVISKEVEQPETTAETIKMSKAEPDKPLEDSKTDGPTGSKDPSDAESSAALEKASTSLAAGKKALLQAQPQQAVEHLAEACRLQSAVHGDMSDNMCEHYFYYGRALLELARIEDNVLGNALSGVPEGEDVDSSQVEDPDKLSAEEKEDVAQQVDEALAENYSKGKVEKDEAVETKKDEAVETKKDEAVETKKDAVETKKDEAVETKKDEAVETKKDEAVETKKDEAVETKKDESVETKKDESVETKKDESVETKKDESVETKKDESVETKKDADIKNGDAAEAMEDVEVNGVGEATEEGEEEAEGDEEMEEGEETAEGDSTQEEEEDVPSLQLAWEVLELAKTIYEKREKKSDDEILKLSQVYLKLGEVSLENENYPESINMYTECLKLQESVLPAEDRWLAETHYQLGVAHSLSDNFDEAVKHLDLAISVIQARVKSVTEKLGDVKVTQDLDTSALSAEQKAMVSDVRDLEKLLPELQEKVADIKDTKSSFTEKLKAMKDLDAFKSHFSSGQLGGGSSGKAAFEDGASCSGFGGETKSAKPIATTLIRKKRKPEETAVPAEVAKKPRTEPEEEKETVVKEASKVDDKTESAEKETVTKEDKKSEESKDTEMTEEKAEPKKSDDKTNTSESTKESVEEKMDVQESEDKLVSS